MLFVPTARLKLAHDSRTIICHLGGGPATPAQGDNASGPPAALCPSLPFRPCNLVEEMLKAGQREMGQLPSGTCSALPLLLSLLCTTQPVWGTATPAASLWLHLMVEKWAKEGMKAHLCSTRTGLQPRGAMRRTCQPCMLSHPSRASGGLQHPLAGGHSWK